MLVRPLLLITLLTAIGCTRDKPAAAPDAAPAPSPVARSSTVATSTTPDNAQLLATVLERLAHERDHRPSGTPSIEAVLEALKAAGLSLTPGQQVLGARLDAGYCWQSGTTDGAIGFSLCEFESAEKAQAGRKTSESRSAVFGERTMLLNTKTLMTIKATGAGSEAAIAKVKSVFEALPPR